MIILFSSKIYNNKIFVDSKSIDSYFNLKDTIKAHLKYTLFYNLKHNNQSINGQKIHLKDLIRYLHKN
jgi:hypothetical protein